MKLTTRKLLILGSSFFIGAPVVFFLIPCAYGFYQGMHFYRAAELGQPIDPQMEGRFEVAWVIFPTMLFCGVMAFTGLALIIAGIIRCIAKGS